MATFPDISPDMESDYERDELLLRAPFGDGYTQTAGDGIRPYRDKWNMSFTNRSRNDIDLITVFLDGLHGESFEWQSPLSSAATFWKYLNSYRVWKTGPDAFNIEFEIEGVTL